MQQSFDQVLLEFPFSSVETLLNYTIVSLL